jgi:DNA replication protein DnaD
MFIHWKRKSMSIHKLKHWQRRMLQAQQVGDALLTRLHAQTMALQPEDMTADVVAGAYVKLSGVQMKWCELELALLREMARQQEQPSAKKKESTQPHDAVNAEPLSPYEWEAIEDYIAQKSVMHDVADYTSNP